MTYISLLVRGFRWLRLGFNARFAPLVGRTTLGQICLRILMFSPLICVSVSIIRWKDSGHVKGHSSIKALSHLSTTE